MSDKQQSSIPAVEAPPRQLAYGVSDPRRKSSALAGFLSIVPGLGQVYVGYYQRGFMHVFIFGSVFAFVAAANPAFQAIAPLAFIFMIFFWLYNIVDAFRRAALYNLSLEGVEQITLPDDLSGLSLGGSFIGGGSLLLFGVVALSNTAFGLSLRWMEDWWPVVPMAFGIYLVYRAYQDKISAEDNSYPPADTRIQRLRPSSPGNIKSSTNE